MAYMVINYGTTSEPSGHSLAYRDVTETEQAAWEAIIEDVGQTIHDSTFPWQHLEVDEKSACLWDDEDRSGYARSLVWYPINIGTSRWVVVKGVAEDGGGISVNVIGEADDYCAAKLTLNNAYAEELANPSFYAGWDEEYSFVSGGHAQLSVETMDMVIDLRIVSTEQTFVGRGFEYIG